MLDAKHLEVQGEKFTEDFSNLLELHFTPEQWTKFYVQGLGPLRVQLYTLAQFYANEADKCRSAGNFFSACLMTASAIESLLAVLCLTSQNKVLALPIYKKFRGKGSFEERVLLSDFQNYVEVASHLDWVPSNVVAPEIFEAAVQDFPLVVSNLFPALSAGQAKEKIDAFRFNPGIEMLRLLQHMRNLVHGPRWSRLGIAFSPNAFEDDCKFVIVIATQVFFCLAETFIRIATEGIANIEALKANLPDAAWDIVVKQVKAMVGEKPASDGS